MDVRQLRYFLAIARCGSFSRAALELNVAQPALSHHVANLEAELGVRLLDRSKRGVVATECGVALMGHAEIILRQMAHAMHDVQRRSDQPSGPVTIGLPSSLAIEMTLPLLKEIEARYPAIVPRIVENHSGYLADLLLNGQVDIAMLFDVEEPGLYELELVLTEPLMLVSSVSGPFAGRTSVAMDELLALPLITTTAQNGLRRLIENKAAERAIAATFRMELDSLQAIKRLVAAGYANSVLSWYAVREEAAAGSLHVAAITEPELWRDVSLARARDWPRSRAADVVWNICADLVRQLTTSDHLRGKVPGKSRLIRKPPQSVGKT